MSGPDGVLLQTENLTRSFGSLVAVNAVSLTVRRGELRSIIGPNGAGKTTFFRLVSGEMAPSSGRVIFQEADITGLPQHRVCRLGIAKSYQITNIFPHLSVLENVRVAVQGYARSFNFWSRADAPGRLPGPRGRAPRHRRASPAGPSSSPRISPTARSATSRSASRSPPIRCCCCWTSRPRA